MTYLEEVGQAFTELASIVSRSSNVRVKKFVDACSLFSSLFGILEMSLRFAMIDYVGKVNDLAEASRSISTLEEMVDRDIQANCVHRVGSHTRNLLKIKRGLEMIKVVCEQLLATRRFHENSLKDAALNGYNRVLYPYHGYNIQQACAAGLGSLPSTSFVLQIIGETEATAKMHMQSYVTASAPVIAYLNNLFYYRNLGIDW